MKDYFGEFLIKNPPPVRAGSRLGVVQAPRSRLAGASDKIPLKFHLMWALIAGSVAVLSWKGSGFYTRYKLMQAETGKTGTLT